MHLLLRYLLFCPCDSSRLASLLPKTLLWDTSLKLFMTLAACVCSFQKCQHCRGLLETPSRVYQFPSATLSSFQKLVFLIQQALLPLFNFSFLTLLSFSDKTVPTHTTYWLMRVRYFSPLFHARKSYFPLKSLPMQLNSPINELMNNMNHDLNSYACA